MALTLARKGRKPHSTASQAQEDNEEWTNKVHPTGTVSKNPLCWSNKIIQELPKCLENVFI